jgi:hypothetical protein
MMSSPKNRSHRAEQLCDGCEKSQNCFFCAACNAILCDTCWSAQVAHKLKRPDMCLIHEKMDYDVVVKLKKILEPPTDNDAQKSMHEADEHTTWFGVSPENTHFWDSGRYATIMAETLSESDRERYPQLVSFIGQTGMKSTSDIRASGDC